MNRYSVQIGINIFPKVNCSAAMSLRKKLCLEDKKLVFIDNLTSRINVMLCKDNVADRDGKLLS